VAVIGDWLGPPVAIRIGATGPGTKLSGGRRESSVTGGSPGSWVTRAWSAWLAADRPERGWRYRAFEEALGEEERAAAEVERVFELAEAGQQAELGDG
jgi:hypothetical protein